MKKYNLALSILLLTVFVNLYQASAQVTLNLKFFIQGYYTGNGMMRPVMKNELVSNATVTQTDTVIIELHNTTSPYAIVASFQGIVNTNGTIACSFSNAINGGNYYIGVRHRNTVQTWSALPVSMNSVTNYDFSTDSTKAYGHSMSIVWPNTYAFYNGDVNQDQNMDLIDFPPLDFGINNGLYGYYASDLNGDGNVDLFDTIICMNNINLGIFSSHP